MDDYIIFDDYTVDDFSKFNVVITVDPIVEEYSEEECEEVYQKYGNTISTSIRTGDFIVRSGNHFYLNVPRITKQTELDVVDRLRSRLVDAGMYFFADTTIDARIPDNDNKFRTWYKVAV